jgi:hypothetical protein
VLGSIPTSPAGRLALALVLAGMVGVGLFAGRTVAYQQSVGGMTGAFSGISLAVIAVPSILATWIGVAVVAKLARARTGVVRNVNVLALASLVVGAVVGNVTAAATGGTYVEPVVLSADGTTEAAITSASAAFEPTAGGAARCASEPDGSALASLTALDLGELGQGTLRASILIVPARPASTSMELFIDGADRPAGTEASWTGTGSVTTHAADWTTATIDFTDLRPLTDPKLPAPAAPWDTPLSGTISWTCEPWSVRTDG